LRVIGVDLSLTSTGIADANGRSHRLLKPSAVGYRRLREIRADVLHEAAHADLVVVEGLAPGYAGGKGGKSNNLTDLAGLWWIVTEALDAHDVPLAVVAPATIKKYATGNGKAAKEKVFAAAIRRFEWFDGDNNQADATWASALGYDWLECPVLPLPQTHRDALGAVKLTEPAWAA
jgi:hypothetical protein